PLAIDRERAHRIVIEIWPWPTQGQHRWVDGKRLPVEYRLREVLAALEVAATLRATQRDASERDRVRRQVDWEFAMAQAKLLAIKERHLRVLRHEVEAWKFAGDLREFVHAMRARLAQLSGGDEASNAARWLDWADDFLKNYDPVHMLPGV